MLHQQKVILVYFSPCGTTLKTLNLIAQGMGCTAVEHIDMSKPEERRRKHEFCSDDVVLYGTSTGALLFAPNKEIFASLQGNGALFVGVTLFGGGYYGVTLRQLQKRATRQGFRVIGLGAFIGQHSGNSEMATGRPDQHDATIASQFGRDIAAKAECSDFTLHSPISTGWSSSLLYNTVVFSRLFMLGSDYELPPFMKKKEIDADRCIQCHICEKNCPTEAIDLGSRQFDLSRCVACYRCVNRCPRKAITVTSGIINAVNRDFAKRLGSKRLEPTIIL